MGERLPRIGIFDSGVGGLTVLAACAKRVPAEYFYLGDNGRAPYGSRPAGEIAAFTREGMEVFEKIGVDAAVLACNTATAVCLEEMRRETSFPVVGMEPAVKLAAEHCRDALVIATERTAESARLARLVELFPATRFSVVPTPYLAGAIERGLKEGRRIDVARYLPERPCDGVVLGCTHYSFYAREIASFYGAPTFDGAEGTANRLADVIFVGTADHHCPRQNPNIYLTFEVKQKGKTRVNFLGKWGKINETVYNSKHLF